MLKTAFGVVGLTPGVFWCMSWREYELALRGFFEHESQEAKRALYNAQLTGYYAVKPYLKKGMTFERFAGIKKEREKTLPSKEELRYMVKKMGKFIDKSGIGYN